MQANIIDRLVAGVGDFARDYEIRRHAARMHDHVARYYHLELVIGNYLRLGLIRAAASTLKTYRLTALSIYITLEPCVMCVGAMLNARIARVVYGARDDKAGALGSVYDIGRDGRLNHRFEVIGGVMESECAELMREFFRARRGGE